MKTFAEYLLAREGLLPVEPPAKGLSKINTTHMTQDRRRKMSPAVPPAAPVGRVKPTIAAVMPPESVPDFKLGRPTGSWFWV